METQVQPKKILVLEVRDSTSLDALKEHIKGFFGDDVSVVEIDSDAVVVHNAFEKDPTFFPASEASLWNYQTGECLVLF